ncbi:MAG: proline iminopeptidase, partial [Flavobacteriales bacterium]
MKLNWIYFAIIALVAASCTQAPSNNEVVPCPDHNEYLNYDGNESKWTGGVQMIPIQTELGEFKVWTKRIGNNP